MPVVAWDGSAFCSIVDQTTNLRLVLTGRNLNMADIGCRCGISASQNALDSNSSSFHSITELLQHAGLSEVDLMVNAAGTYI